MSDTTHGAPERMWAGKYHGTWWQSRPHHQMTEYVRADLVQAAEQRGYANAMEAERKLHEARIEELEAERDEVLNQLDSARHSVAVLEKRVKTFCEGWGVADKGRIESESKLAKLRTFIDELWDSQGYDARELHDLLNELDDE